MTFKNGEEMLRYLRTNGDLYSPTYMMYVFLYNECGSIARYDVSNEQASMLAAKSVEHDGEYWGAFLGCGGEIYDSPESEHYEEGCCTPLAFCNEYAGAVWIDTKDWR